MQKNAKFIKIIQRDILKVFLLDVEVVDFITMTKPSKKVEYRIYIRSDIRFNSCPRLSMRLLTVFSSLDYNPVSFFSPSTLK